MTAPRNFVSPYPTWQERIRHAWRIVVRMALPGAAVLVALWWWIAG